MSLGQYVRGHAINRDGIETLLNCWTQPGFGADPDQLSLLFVIFYVACSGNESTPGTFERDSDTKDGAQGGGSSAVRSSSRCDSRASSARGWR